MLCTGLKVRSSLTAALYSKSLRVSATGNAAPTASKPKAEENESGDNGDKSGKKKKKEKPKTEEAFSTGEIVNLMSVDIQRVVDIMPYLNMMWSAPLQIFLSIYFLWEHLGPSVLAGLATMILLIPINGWTAAKSRNFQMKQMKEKDKRVKQMNEILQGMKILKLYAWEPSFRDQVTEIRHREIRFLKQMAYLQAGTSFVWTCAPFLVSLVSFATYVLSSEDNILDSKKAFVSLSLFNIMRFPLSMLPMTISGLVQCNVAFKRINKFMNAEEVKSEVKRDLRTPEAGENAIQVEGATFTWEASKADSGGVAVATPADEDGEVRNPLMPKLPAVNDVSFNVETGGLVAVVGAVGAGKTSILSALLGEMERVSGEVSLKGSVSYVPQQAWIQNATIEVSGDQLYMTAIFISAHSQSNILFGREKDKERYELAVANSCLEDDFRMLPAGDQTEIGEKGINLSGGQKQRVSLARAIYYDTDVYLLDDPLSAVDAHVVRSIQTSDFKMMLVSREKRYSSELSAPLAA